MNKNKYFLVTPLFVVLAAGCSSSSSSGSGIGSVPAVAPIVDSSLPSTLKAGTSVVSKMLSAFKMNVAKADAGSDLNGDLDIVFKSTYNSISGGTYTGYINSLLSDLDSRMQGLVTQTSGKTVSCAANASQTYTLDLSAVDTSMKLALDLQCSDTFSGGSNVAAAGSGVSWGQNANGDFSLWLTLNHTGSAGDGFGYAAKVTNPNTTAKTVDMVYVEASSQNSRGSIARLKATPASNTFELLYASTSPNAISPANGSQAHTGCQFQMISNGTLIYVKGNFVTAGNCAGGTVETACFNADLSVNSSAGACNTLAASFTISAAPNTFTHAELDGISPTTSQVTLYNAIQQTNASSVTTALTLQ